MHHKLFITGDTHRFIDVAKLQSIKATKEDYVIILGDVGIIWFGDERDNEAIDFYESLPFSIIYIDGNHENFTSLNSFPIVDFNGAKAHQISKSIVHILRGEIFNLNDKTFFCFGGAQSTDKHLRTSNVSWWKEEVPTNEEYYNGINNLHTQVDYILTHECPSSIKEQIGYRSDDEVSRYLEFIKTHMLYNKWFFAHHHIDKVFGKHECLYRKIKEIT